MVDTRSVLFCVFTEYRRTNWWEAFGDAEFITPIGGNDLIIAAQAVILALKLVSDNDSEFARVTEFLEHEERHRTIFRPGIRQIDPSASGARIWDPGGVWSTPPVLNRLALPPFRRI